ncbi:MAG TPA: sigma-70 family RNA polymerase sigma factor [Bacillota bacterium]|nr:sigma-70 family RNA polymerase sigma factor [Bacillota bacterium]HPJ23846.1 sigma-70 family RNA polymerase sigma factor [Bacillota bacterium]
MIFRNYNDFEIVNLIKQGNEEAFDFMVEKYQYLIAKKIRKFNLTDQFDDLFQEALMILHKSVLSFDESYNKTFTRYFELNLVNKLITIKNKSNKYGQFLSEKLPGLYYGSVKESMNYYISENEIRTALETLSDLEKQVFQIKIIEKRTVRETADFLNMPEKKIYNALDRIKNKLKLHLM